MQALFTPNNIFTELRTLYEPTKYEQGMKPPVRRNDLVYPELSYEVVGCAYEVFDELGPGHSEKIYQKSYAVALKIKSIPFKEQVYYSLKFKNEIVGKGFLDFLVDDKIIIELKKDGISQKLILNRF